MIEEHLAQHLTGIFIGFDLDGQGNQLISPPVGQNFQAANCTLACLKQVGGVHKTGL
jgi:hypothetical protein